MGLEVNNIKAIIYSLIKLLKWTKPMMFKINLFGNKLF